MDALKPITAELCSIEDSAITAAVAGLARDRSKLLHDRSALLNNPVWCRFDEHWRRFTEDVKAIDDRIDKLIAGGGSR